MDRRFLKKMYCINTGVAFSDKGKMHLLQQASASDQ